MDDIMEKESREDQSWYSWLRTLVCVVLATVLVFTLVVRIVRVERQSMRETLQNGDILLTVNRHLAGELKAGDIVVIKKEYFEDGKPIVKRIIATEGQTVDIDFDAGVVYVDGQALEEDYIREPTYLDEGLEFPITVPEGCLFLLGDNRNNSMDSRYPDLGPVDVRCVIGKAVVLVFPGKTAETGKRDFGRIGGL
ncbi:signal peptidase I [Dysosmobacter sp. Sow4_B12]|uniref:signal peptidase I n=1 Tax=Dysosmobacter sp. Sow4_B12 TaxID=3438777 RepID=UPI003F93192B